MNATTTETDWIHPFARTGHGSAPFRVVGYEKSTYQACQGAPIVAGSSCDHCGTGIMHVFWIKGSGPADERFKVGIDCVRKTGAEAPEKASAELLEACKKARKSAEYQARREAWKGAEEARKAQREADRLARVEENRRHCAPMIAQIERIQAHGSDFAKRVAEDMLATIEKGWPLTDRQGAFLAKLAEESQPRTKDSQHVGKVGERGTFTLTVTGFVPLPSVRFGYVDQPRTLVKMADSEGNIVVWFTGVPDMERGKTYTMTASVVKHDSRDGQAQTVVKNCRIKAG